MSDQALSNNPHNRVKIENAILTWPYLYRKQVFEGVETKYRATLLVDKENPIVNQIKTQCSQLITEADVKVKKENWCISDGDEYENEFYHDKIVIKPGSHKMPLLFNAKGEHSHIDDGEFYAGCIVNALVSFWINTKGTNRVVGELHGVFKVADGERLIGVSDDVVAKELLGEDAAKAAMDSNKLNYGDDEPPF